MGIRNKETGRSGKNRSPTFISLEIERWPLHGPRRKLRNQQLFNYRICIVFGIMFTERSLAMGISSGTIIPILSHVILLSC
jgi:hypothetical protein